MSPLSDLPADLSVPELDLPRAVEVPSYAVEVPSRPEPEVPLELAALPGWHVATGVRSKPCPVCLAELPLTQSVCHECGERLVEESGLVVAGSSWTSPARVARQATPAPPPPRTGALVALADAIPLGVGKRLLLYPLLAIFFCRLLIPCRFHETGVCLLLALFGGLVVVAHRKVYRSSLAEE